MARKINLPSVVGLDTEGVPYSMVVFLQAVQDSLNVLDRNVVYADNIRVATPQPNIRAKTAQGQAFVVEGVNVASGDDYTVLVQNFESLLQYTLALGSALDSLIRQINTKGT